MSVNRPHIKSVAQMTSERAVVGHIVDAVGIFKSLTRIGVKTFDPVIKNSYTQVSFGFF